MHAINWWNHKYLGAPIQVPRGRNFAYVRYMGCDVQMVDFTQKIGKGWSHFDPLPKESRNMGQMGRKLGKNLWKMGIKSEHKLGKSLNKHEFPFSLECVRVLWRSWPHIVKLNEWTSVTAIVNFCPMTCRLCYMSTDALNGCAMGPLLVLVSPCFREIVVVTCKIVSFLCSFDNLLQNNVIVFFFENQISKWRSFEKRAIFDPTFHIFS